MKKLGVFLCVAAAVACGAALVACSCKKTAKERATGSSAGCPSASDAYDDSTATSGPTDAGSASGASASDSPAETAFPAKFDLRDKGIVTPVKFQNPWGACWSFGGIAAAETSVLTALGMTAEQYKEKTGSDFNLSENHLVWFSRLPITAETNSEQAGEGLYVIGWLDGNDQFAMYDGGDSTLITSMFANGVGPVDEDLFPYRGKEGITDWDYFSTYDTDPADVQAEKVKEVRISEERYLGMTVDEAVQKVLDGQANPTELFKELHDKGYVDASWPQEGKSKDELVKELENAYYQLKLETLCVTNYYTRHDDWVIPVYEETEDGKKLPNRDIFCGYTLLHGNILPETVVRDDDYHAVGTDQDAIAAIKSELLAGHGVSIRFRADQSVPGQKLSRLGYINLETWAQYTYEDQPVTHGVCIVGWDDSITKDTFNSDPAKQPPADGAWIVKNSWGSETEYTTTESGETIGFKDWGIVNDEGKHTGYFYLSYYDKSIESPESMVFDTDFAEHADGFRVYAHDYMPCTVIDLPDTQSDMTMTANVFVNEEGVDQEMLAVATRTANAGDEVKYRVYLLAEGATSPEDGELVATQTATYDYRGFHREKLDTPVTIKDGQRFSIVVMEKGKDESGADQYSYATVCSNSKKYAEENDFPSYGISVIHEGESFVYDGGAWSDWTEILPKFREEHDAGDDYVFDNFSIKAYMVAKA